MTVGRKIEIYLLLQKLVIVFCFLLTSSGCLDKRIGIGVWLLLVENQR